MNTVRNSLGISPALFSRTLDAEPLEISLFLSRFNLQLRATTPFAPHRQVPKLQRFVRCQSQKPLAPSGFSFSEVPYPRWNDPSS